MAAAVAARQPPSLDLDNVPFGKPPPLQPGEQDGPGHSKASGTGFIIAPGRVMTNNHVVETCTHIVARNAAGREQAARVDAMDRDRDLALLTVAPDFGPPLVFRDGPAMRRGDAVVTYGFPLLGLLSSGPTLTTGEVSALSGLHDDQGEFEISAPVQPGNSGGPLLDMEGAVVGVIVAKLNATRIAALTDGDIPQNVNFAIKGSEALAFLHEQNVTPDVRAGTGAPKGAAVVGEMANPSTVLLRCYR